MVLRRITIGFAVIGFLLIAGWILFWFYAADQFEVQLTGWAVERRSQGYQVSYRLSEIEGFPTRLKAQVFEPFIAAPRGWRWQGPELVAQSAALNPLYIRIAAPGKHEVVVSGDGRNVEAAVEAATADLDLWLTPWGALDGLRWLLKDISLSTIPYGDFHLDKGRLLLRRGRLEDGSPSGDAEFALDLEAVALPELGQNPFGSKVETIAAEGALHKEPPRKLSREELLAWQGRDGRISLARLQLLWGPLAVLAKGDIRLDAELRPEADLTAEVSGFVEVIQILEEMRLINSGAALAANLALAALSRIDPETGEPVVTLPIKIRQGQVYLGPVALFQISPVL